MPTQDSWGSLATRANDRVERWLQATPLDNSSAHDLIEGARSEAGGLGFAQELLELVAASDDAFISALGLRRLSHDLPDGLSTRDRFALRAGSVAALGLPSGRDSTRETLGSWADRTSRMRGDPAERCKKDIRHFGTTRSASRICKPRA